MAELLRRDNAAAFIDRADVMVRNRALRASGNGWEAPGGMVIAGCEACGGLLEPGLRESDGAAGRAWDASVGD